MPTIFSLDTYVELLGTLQKAGYRAVDFSVDRVRSGEVLLRHDVDVCLERAAIMAAAERCAGWSATYYLLVSSDLYNISSSSGRSLVHAIANAGHKIGLHFDATVYGGDSPGSAAELEAHAERECRILEDVVGEPVSSISFHRPVEAFQGRPGRFAGRAHSYEPRFFRDIEYCSDSGGAWHHGAPLEREAVKVRAPLQLLTHPVWWVSSAEATVPDKVEAVLHDRCRWLREELGRNIKPYAEHLASSGASADPSSSNER